MCELCTDHPDKAGHFTCPDNVEWPDQPWTHEQERKERHAWARFERNSPERAQSILDDLGREDCDHENHHVMVQNWQGVNILVKVCNGCGATIPATNEYT